MKRLAAIALALGSLIGTPVLAADIPVKALRAAPPPVFSWTGCYIGGHIGWGWGRNTFSDASSDASRSLVGLLTGPPAFSPSSIGADTDGFLGGGQAGCDYQFAPRWVIGAEGQFSFADISGNVSGTRTPSVFSSESGTFSAKADWLASATARLGYAWAPGWLLYIKGGAAWAHDKYNVERQTTVVPVGAIPVTYVASETRAGWTVGGGVEWAFADHWSTRLEYQFYGFGSRELAFVSNRNEPNRFVNVEQQIHTLKLGVNYRF